MKPRTIKISYWTLAIIFTLLMGMDGVAGVMRAEGGKQAMKMLGYPEYILSIVGMAKLLGALAIIQNKFKTIKEWAFAGFAINFVGASASWAFAANEISFVFIPLIVFAFMLVLYYFWKKFNTVKSSSDYNVRANIVPAL